jgi:RNA polymerase sigma factor (sigma-70 family)
MHSPLDDNTLLHQLKAGNYTAFTAIYNQYVKSLTRYGLKFNPDLSLIEDCLHDLFVWLWQNRDTLHINSSLKAYLFRALRNTLLRKTSRDRRTTHIEDPEADYRFELSFSPDAQVFQDEQQALLARQVQELVGQLTPRQKEIIYLRFYEELSFEEIAGQMGLSVKAAYKLMGRSMATLRAVFPREWSLLLCLLT